MKDYKNILIIFSFILSSCIKEKQTMSYLKLTNSTGHSIQMVPYKNGTVFTSNVKALSPNSTIELEHNFTRGINEEPVIFNTYVTEVDSIQVIWDSKDTITHLHLASDLSSTNHYPISSNRNLFKQGSYKTDITGDTKHSRTWEVVYTFTEQDYLDAK